MRSLTLLFPKPNPLSIPVADLGKTAVMFGAFHNLGGETWQTAGLNADVAESNRDPKGDRRHYEPLTSLTRGDDRSSDRPNPSMIFIPPRSGQAPRTGPSSALSA